MLVTREWIFEHRTRKGAWTRAQLAAIGVSWPPISGWVSRVVGSTISEEDKRQFETNKEPLTKELFV